MRLTKEQVEKLTLKVLEGLKKKELLTFKADEHAVLKKMNDVFMADLKAEDDLDKEVEKMLESHSGEIGTQRLDYRKMFTMVKHKLAKERGIVL
ncbi:MAG: DUF507 family protein [Deltaproteobacteria bacterium]|nr:DUF507 family protein [Deltaproteobacteria bacterium]